MKEQEFKQIKQTYNKLIRAKATKGEAVRLTAKTHKISESTVRRVRRFPTLKALREHRADEAAIARHTHRFKNLDFNETLWEKVKRWLTR